MLIERRRPLELDYLLIALSLFLVVYGIVTIAGVTLDSSSAVYSNLWKKQSAAAALGLLAGAALVFVNYRWLLAQAYWVYGATLLMLLLLLLGFGTTARGAHSWVDIPLIGFRFQPSEIAKLSVVLVLARHLSAREGRFDSLLSTFPALILAAVPAVLILKQPDLGMAMIFPLVALGMLYAAGCPAGRLLLLCSPALAAIPPMLWRIDETISGPACFFVFLIMLAGIIFWNYRIRTRWVEIAVFAGLACVSFVVVSQHFENAFNRLKPHQQDRILVWLQPEGYQQDLAYQVTQSKIAIGSGGLVGKGWRQGTQSRLNYLPEKHNDFIFSILAEERGFLGVLVLLGAFGVLLMRGVGIARGARHHGGALLAMGIVILFASYLFINVSICMGLLPVTGLPLIFISYGGSSVLSSLLAVSLLVNVHLRRRA